MIGPFLVRYYGIDNLLLLLSPLSSLNTASDFDPYRYSSSPSVHVFTLFHGSLGHFDQIEDGLAHRGRVDSGRGDARS